MRVRLLTKDWCIEWKTGAKNVPTTIVPDLSTRFMLPDARSKQKKRYIDSQQLRLCAVVPVWVDSIDIGLQDRLRGIWLQKPVWRRLTYN